MRKLIAASMSALMISTGCASAGRTPASVAPQHSVVNTSTMADYVQRIPAGSKMRVEQTDGRVLRGTLMKATPDVIVVQRNTRIPESPVEVPVAQIARVTIDNGGGSTAKSVAIGIASGVGAFFAILAIAFAAGSD